MKRIFPLILSIIIVCVCLVGCGGDGKSADEFDESTFAIDSEYVAGLLADYMQSDSYLGAVAEYEKQIARNGGCLLEKAMEYHLYEYDDFKIDAILFQLKCNVAYGEGVIDDSVCVYVDLNSGEVHDSLGDEYLEISLNLDGVPDSEEELRSTLMNVLRDFNMNSDEVFFHWKAHKKALGEDEIAAVNEKLGLSYMGYESAAEAESSVDQATGNPIISTDSQERVQKATEMAMALKETAIYQEASFDASTIRIRAAMEYKNDNFGSGYPVHIIMINADNINTEYYGLEAGTVLLDMKSGELYTVADLDLNNMTDINSFSSEIDAYPWCILCYNNILEGGETQLWASSGETIIELDREELAAVNDFLASHYASEAAEKDTLRQEAAAKLTAQQKLIFDAAMEFSKTAHYRERALAADRISLSNASEFIFTHPENGFELHALLLMADSIDTDMYGFMSGVYLKDLNTELGYAESFMDLSNWSWDFEDYSDINNVYAACILSYDSVLSANESHLFMNEDCDRLIHFTKEDIDAVNAALNP
ncbi:MAG: hypothetical protein IKC02_01110 [Oscillospiraceae bacterium]|nr:hypothetical protein [Oscillospiraceae bacterium]